MSLPWLPFPYLPEVEWWREAMASPCRISGTGTVVLGAGAGSPLERQVWGAGKG